MSYDASRESPGLKEHIFQQNGTVTYTFDDLPLDEEIWLMDERWISEFDEALSTTGFVFDGGYITKVIARSRTAHTINLDLYLVLQRFHVISIVMPRSEFIIGIDRPSYDIKLRAFVRGDWLSSLHLRKYSSFAMIDAIGVKKALEAGTLTMQRLLVLRNRLDDFAAAHPQIGFISFADSLLLKIDWTIGQHDSDVKYDYAPEIFIRLFLQLQELYRSAVSLEIYGVMTQGANEYDGDHVLHISPTHNHISLNSLGVPFAQLMAINETVSHAIRDHNHGPYDLYMDRSFFLSLDLKYAQRTIMLENAHQYCGPLNDSGFYVCASIEGVLANLS